jgi:hypothetical protein
MFKEFVTGHNCTACKAVDSCGIRSLVLYFNEHPEELEKMDKGFRPLTTEEYEVVLKSYIIDSDHLFEEILKFGFSFGWITSKGAPILPVTPDPELILERLIRSLEKRYNIPDQSVPNNIQN